MVLKKSLLTCLLLSLSPSCLALQQALEKMNSRKSNAYYFAEIKKMLHDMDMRTFEESQPLFNSWKHTYTLEDYQASLYEFLIREVLICDDYNTFKSKLIEDDLTTEPKNINVMQAFQKWNQTHKEKKHVDDIFANDLQQLCKEVSIYQKKTSKSGDNQYNSSPLTRPNAFIYPNLLYEKYGIWLLYTCILLLSGALIWLASYTKKDDSTH